MKKQSTIRFSGLALLTFFLFFTFPQVRNVVQGSFPVQKEEEKKEQKDKREAGKKEKQTEKEASIQLQKQPEAVLPDVPPKPFRIFIPDMACPEYFAFPGSDQSVLPVQQTSFIQVCILFFTSIQRNAP